MATAPNVKPYVVDYPGGTNNAQFMTNLTAGGTISVGDIVQFNGSGVITRAASSGAQIDTASVKVLGIALNAGVTNDTGMRVQVIRPGVAVGLNLKATGAGNHAYAAADKGDAVSIYWDGTNWNADTDTTKPAANVADVIEGYTVADINAIVKVVFKSSVLWASA